MFKVKTWKVTFRRQFHEPDRRTGRYDTICEIWDSAVPVPISRGIAKLHPNDSVDKKKGKIIALTHALNLGTERPTRTLFWREFWKWLSTTDKKGGIK